MATTTTNDTGRDEAPAAVETTTGEWQLGLPALGAAAVLNLVILGIGAASGVDYALQTQADAPVMDVTAVHVVVTSVASLLIGLGVAHLARRRGPRALRVRQIMGGVVAVASAGMPLAASGDSGARLTLALMHLVVGAAWVAALSRMRRA